MIGALNEQQIEELLLKQVIGRIACHRENLIYIIPISYAYEGGAIYCRGFNGLKLDIMRQNPDVCFEADDITDMANWQSVIAWGKFEELKDDDRKKGLEILIHRHLPLSSSVTTHLGKAWPFSEQDIEEITGIVFRINITKRTGRFEQFSSAGPTFE